MKEIILTQGKVALVDDEDYESLSKYNWYAQKENRGYGYFAARRVDRSSMLLMHRVIMNTPSHLVVDHIDHDGLNNQKSNLRNCTQGCNVQNTKVRHGSYRGVWQQRSGNWTAEIQYKGKKVRLGTYTTIEEAALAYNKAAVAYYGEFAFVNSIKECIDGKTSL